MPAYVHSVNHGRVFEAAWAGRLRRTAIDKRPVTRAVAVGELGVAGDEQADVKYHGGRDKAVYAFAREDLDRWEQVLGRSLHDGQFGENLTTSGIDVNEALVGERWRVGEALLEVCSVRIPCRVFANWLQEQGWVRRFTADARPGPYLRVVEPGLVAAGDPIAVEHRPRHELTVSVVFQAMTTRSDLLTLLLEVPELEDDLADQARRQLRAKPTLG
jgi:MOSC domain-containing protein YiiM